MMAWMELHSRLVFKLTHNPTLPSDAAAMRLGRVQLAVILGVAYLLGALIVIRLPPLGAYDELYHWLRVVQISQGQFLPDRVGAEWGGAINAADYNFHAWMWFRFLDAKPIRFADAWDQANALSRASAPPVVVVFSNYATFSPLAYLPQATGVWLARSLGANPLLQVLAGRLANLTAYIGMVAFIVRTLTAGRAIFLALALTPTMIYLAGALGADPLNFIIPAALFAVCLRYRDRTDNVLEHRRWVTVAVLTAAVGLLKIVCLVFAAAPLLIPWQRFGSMRNKVLFVGGAMAVSALLWVAWNASFPYDIAQFWHLDYKPRGLDYPLRQPARTFKVLLATVQNFAMPWWRELYDRVGAIHWFPQHPPEWIGEIALPVMLLLALADAGRRDLPASASLAGSAVAFAVVLMLAFLTTFTPPTWTVMTYIEGRYFIIFCVLAGWAIGRLGLLHPWLKRPLPALLAATLVMNAIFLLVAVRFYDGVWLF
jgi:hypothetical protein